MNKSIYYLIFLFSLKAFGMNLDPNTLKNNLVNNNLASAAKRTCDQDKEKIQQLAKSCVNKICGPASKINSVFLTGAELDDFDFSQADEVFRQIKPDISLAMENNLKLRKKMRDRLIEKIEGKNGLESNPVEISNLFISLVKKNLNISYNVDSKKTDISYDKVSNDTKNNQEMVALVQSWIKKELGTNLLLRRDLNLPIRFPEYISYMESEKLKVQKITDADPNLDTELFNHFREFSYQLNQIKRNPKTTPNYYRKTLDDMENLKNHTEYKTGMKLISPFDLCYGDKKCHKRLKVMLKQYIKERFYPTLKQQNLIVTSDEQKKKLLKACKAPYYLMDYNRRKSMNHNPKEIYDNLGNTLNDIFLYVGKNLSSHTGRELRNKSTYDINKKVVFGRADNGNEVSFKADLLLVKAGEFNKANTGNFSDARDINLMYATIYPNDFLNLMESFCVGTESLLVADDFFNQDIKALNVSGHSCEHPVIGSQVIAHEYGHMLSALIQNDEGSNDSMKKYRNLRKCVNKRNALPNYDSLKKNPQSKLFSQDHFRSEEDMADYFMGRVYSSRNKLGDSKNFNQCSALKIENDEYSDVKLEFADYNPHSPVFFRLLNTLVDREIKIPNDCSEVIAKYRHVYNPIKCE